MVPNVLLFPFFYSPFMLLSLPFILPFISSHFHVIWTSATFISFSCVISTFILFPFHVPFASYHFTDMFCSFSLQVPLLFWFSIIFRSFILSSFYFLSLFFDVPVILFTSMSFHFSLLPLAFLISVSFSWHCSFRFMSFSLRFLSLRVHQSLHSDNFLSLSSHDPVIAFHSPFEFSLHFPFLLLSFCLSFPYISTLVSHWFSLPRWTWIPFCGKYFREKWLEQQILSILRRTEKRHRNQSIIVASYALEAACFIVDIY